MDNILPPLLGGILIGLAAATMLVFSGRIAGISGIFSGLLSPQRGDTLWRSLFVAGLLSGGFLMGHLKPDVFPAALETSTPLLIVAGLLVGFGTRLGSGCTSGHGVCGISRFSPRSLAATGTFMAAGIVTVLLMNLLGGSAS